MEILFKIFHSFHLPEFSPSPHTHSSGNSRQDLLDVEDQVSHSRPRRRRRFPVGGHGKRRHRPRFPVPGGGGQGQRFLRNSATETQRPRDRMLHQRHHRQPQRRHDHPRQLLRHRRRAAGLGATAQFDSRGISHLLLTFGSRARTVRLFRHTRAGWQNWILSRLGVACCRYEVKSISMMAK